MTCRLEHIPVEVLLDITHHLDHSSLAHLIACSRHLHQNLVAELYHDSQRRTAAISWACQHGNVDILRRIMTHYAEAKPRTSYYDCLGLGSVYPLDLALERHQLTVFQFLAIGTNDARNLPGLDEVIATGPEYIRASVCFRLRKMLELLCKPSKLEFLRAYLSSFLPDLFRRYHAPHVVLPLIPIIKAGAPVDAIQLLLDRGANPNQICTVNNRTYTCPLSEALMAGSGETVELLIKRGASINGPKSPEPPFRTPLHIPVFATARRLTETGGVEMMQLCLDHGADINHAAWVVSLPVENRDNNPCCYLTTPLESFLRSIKRWDRELVLSPVQALTFLLVRGASTAAQRFRHDLRPPLPFINPSFPISPTIRILDSILREQGIKRLAEPAFLDVVKLLAQTPGIGDKFAFQQGERLFNGKYKNGYEGCDWMFHIREKEGWGELLTAFVKNPRIGSTGLLARLTSGDLAPRPWKMVRFTKDTIGQRVSGQLFFIAVKDALSCGADPNKPDGFGRPPLHRLCYHFRKDINNLQLSVAYPADPEVLMKGVRHLFTLLIRAGADPQLTDSEGITPLEHLERDSELLNGNRFNFHPLEGVYVEYVELLSKILEGVEWEDDYEDCPGAVPRPLVFSSLDAVVLS